MHDNSEWNRSVHRTNYWRPSQGLYLPNEDRRWEPNGRSAAQGFPRYSDSYRHRHTDQRSHDFKWHSYPRNSCQGQSFGAAIQPSMPMAPRHRKRKGRDRGGSRPFPSKLVEKITGHSTAASTGSSSSSHTSSSHNKDSASTLSSTKHQSSSSSSHKSFGANPSSRPDDNSCKSSESSMQGASLNLNLHSADVPTRPPVSSSGTISKSSTSSSSTAVATAASTSSSLSSLSSSTKLPKSLPNIAQTHSVSVPSNNLPKVKILKHSSPAASKPIPMSTLAYCESIPQLRDVLHKTPVVMLERLTEKLIRMQLKHNGLCLKGNWHRMLHKQRKKNTDVQKKAEKGQKKKSLKLIFSLNSKSMLDKKKHKIKKDSPNHKNNKKEFLNSENMLDTKDSLSSSSLLVDPKVMSLSRPLQSAYSNNASMTNMPFKNSGRVKPPSKTFHPKPTGPLPKHMQMFDLDKLRTKLKGANFGGSGRKPGPFPETNLDIHSSEILKSSEDVPVIMSKLSTPSSETTDIINPMSGLDDNMIVRSDVREDMITDDGSVGSDSVHSGHSDSHVESNRGAEMAPVKEDNNAHSTGYKENEVSSVCVIDKCAADSSGDATDFHSGEDRDQSVDVFSGSSDSWSFERHVISKESELSSVPALVPETVPDTDVDSARDSSDMLRVSADELKEREKSNESDEAEIDKSIIQLGNITKDMKHNEVDSSLKHNDSSKDREEYSVQDKDEYFHETKSVDIAAVSESNAADRAVPKHDSWTCCTASDKETLVETRSIDCNQQSSNGMARDTTSSLEQPCLVSKDSNDNVMFVDNDDRNQEIGHTTDRTCEKEELSSQQTDPSDSQETDTIPDDRDQGKSESGILGGNVVKSPNSLTDICHGILKKQDMHLRLPSSEGDGDTQVIEVNVQLENAKVSENPETCLKNEEREDNSQCLSDKPNKDTVTVDITSSVAIDLSSSRTDDDLSPVCIISSVESGAHIYFSETDTDLKPNTKTDEQKERQISGQTFLAATSESQSSTPGTVITNTVSSTGIIPNAGQSTHDTITPSSSGIQNFFHAGLVTNSYPVIVTSSIPVYPIPDVQSVLLTPQNTTLQRHSDPKPNKKELVSKLVSKPRPIKPKGSEQSTFIQMAVPQVPSFPMFLPTIPSAFPPEVHFGKTHHDDIIVDTHLSDCTLTMQNKHEQSGNMTDTVEQASATTAATSDGAHDDNIDANHSHTLTKPEDSKITKSSPDIHEAPMLTDETITNDKTLIPDRMNKGVCQTQKRQDQMTRVLSDLDVMRYDDEPPVLENVHNSDNRAGGEPKMQPLDSDASVSLSDQDMRNPEAQLESSISVVSESSEVEKQDQTYLYVAAGSESSANNSTIPSSNEAAECCIKSQFKTCEQVSQERVEVGRLNLRRAHTEDSDDSDATLIYSCDEENTYFEEIFQEPEGPTWPRNAPWTENEDEKNPLYEGKLVIVSDINEDRDGDSTSDTNTSNERLSLIITTLRKDLEEKKTDRRQAEKEGEKDKEDVTQSSTKIARGKEKRKRPVKPKKRSAIHSQDSSVPKEAENTSKRKMSASKRRKNLIVTIQRRNLAKGMPRSETTENVPEVQATAAVNDSDNGNPRKMKKPRRKIKRRLTAKRRKKKVSAPVVETEADEDIAKEKGKVSEGKRTDSKTRKTITKKRRVTKPGRRKKEAEEPASTRMEEKEPEIKAGNTDSDDSDELPTILPPKRRRMQKNGNPLMMMQNTVGGKGNSSERIMREFPRHNWLEHKINQLQQQTTCSPSEEELVVANTVHQSPTHISDSQPSSEPSSESPHKQDTDPIDDPHVDHPVPSKSPTSINDGSPVAPAAEPCTSSPKDGERKAPHPTATDGSNDKNSFSLNEALKIVGAEETEGGELVIDEAGAEKDKSVIDTSETEHKSGKEDNTQTGVVKKSSSPKLSSALESAPESQPAVDNSTLKSDTTEAKTTGQPLDLCVRKNDKPGGGCIRPKAPPVQMVLPQVQQPARPVSTEPALVKETKDILQTVVTEPPESNTTSMVTKTLTEEALNLTQADSQTPVSLAEMARGIVMPVGTQLQSNVVQQTTDNDQLSQQSQTLAVSPSSHVPVGQLLGPQVGNTELPPTTSPVPLSKSNSSISTAIPPLYGPPFASNSSGAETHSVSRPTGSTIIHPASHMPGPIPGLIPAHGSQHPKPPFPRHHPPRNMEGKDLDKEFEKHFREFKQLEILAAKKEREREALLQMKKRKAMLLREMKMLKTQQNTPHESEGPSHLPGQIFKPSVSNTQHRAQVAELRPFQGTPQSMTGFQKTAPGQQNTHPVYSVPAPLSQTATSPSSNLSMAPLNLVGAGHRKRGISSEDRRPIVEMINLAMLQRTRSKQRRMSEEQRTGPPGSNAVPTPAHQNKTDVIVIHDSDVPSSEITRSPYVKRKTPIHEPPSSLNRCALSSAALVPAHSQPPFQTAGSLIVPAKNAPQEQIPPSFLPPNPHGPGNTAAPGHHPPALHQPHPVSGVQRAPTVNEIQTDHNSKSRTSSESNYNVAHVPQDQPVSYNAPGERMMGNMHPGAFVVDHGSVQQQQWSPRMPNPMSQNQMYTSHQGYPGNQPVRPTAIHSIHQSAHVRPQIAHGIRPDRGMEVIDLTKEPQISKPDIQRHIAGNQHMSGGNEPPSGPKDETESTVQRELTAALARRQGTGFDQQPQQMVRRDNIPNIAHYGPKPYPGHNPVSPQAVPQGQHSSSLYPHQGHAHAGNPMSSLTDAPYASMQNRQSTAGAQYRMQEPTSVKSALLSSGPKPMMSAPNYPMNTSTQAPSYATPQYQQRNTEKSSQMVESYQRMPEKGSMMPGQVPHQQPQSSYADHLNRGGPAMTNQYKPQQPVAWRPQVPTSVSNVPMSIEKQQHMMMMARKSQWQHYSQAQKYPMSPKGANPTMSSSGPSHAMQAGGPPLSQSGGSNYAMAPSSQNQEHSMHMRAAMHNMRMMQRGPAPGSGPVPGPMQAKMQQTMPQGYPRESGMLPPGQGAAPALIEFQEQDNQRRMQQVAMTQHPPRLHQFNGSCVVCGALAMYLCSSCRMVWYCSQTCQNNHWKRHGPECKPIKAGLPGQL